ncbi:probable calcium-binding protein CML46 [Primulina huaijiensis]|uniref:probable calcium-binding protein CML46 n=1 Tax=Primulina huaijiensis TaxID=1492673 RepID=UPI003CC78688
MDAVFENSISFSACLLIKSIYWNIEDLFSRIDLFLQSVPKFLSTKWNSKIQMSNSFEACLQGPVYSEVEKINISEIDLIMSILGVGWCAMEDDDKLFGEDDFLALFHEEEPSFDEIKETFEVFDSNKDGYIDCNDLRRVLYGLGFKEGSGLEDCKRMIRDFDVNGDGLIDFRDFVVFMEKMFLA